MKLQSYILNSIFTYPSLYYKGSYEQSKINVLNQLFLVIGNGISFIKNKDGKGHFGNDYDKKNKLSKKSEKRILNGESIVTVYKKIDENFKKLGFLWPDRNSKEKTMFYSDLLKLNKPFLVLNNKINQKIIDTQNYELFVEFFQDNRILKNDWYPYPFSIKYSSLWDDENNKLVNKSEVADDWLEGIIYIFTEAKKWLEDDIKFNNNQYFNWAINWNENDNQLIINWNKESDKLKLCVDYEILPKKYTDVRVMAFDIVAKQRKKYIDECKKILKYYKLDSSCT